MTSPHVWFLLIATGATMGLSIPLSKMAAAQGIAPLSFVMIPSLVSGLILLGIAWSRHGLPRGGHRLVFFGLVTGLLGSALPNTLIAWLATQAGASFTAIAYTLPPVFTLALALLLGLEAVRWQRLVAIALGLAGALWLASSRMLDGSLAWLSAAALVAIPLSLGAGNVYRARHLPEGVPNEWLGASLAMGSFVLLLPIWLLAPAEQSSVAVQGWPYLLVQIVAALGGVLLFFSLQRKADAVTMSFVGYAIALSGVLLGALLLKESPPWQLLPASALIVAGFWLIQRHPVSIQRATAAMR